MRFANGFAMSPQQKTLLGALRAWFAYRCLALPTTEIHREILRLSGLVLEAP
jgi:hypothetical protein